VKSVTKPTPLGRRLVPSETPGLVLQRDSVIEGHIWDDRVVGPTGIATSAAKDTDALENFGPDMPRCPERGNVLPCVSPFTPQREGIHPSNYCILLLPRLR
jgi:hypothetical protein